LSIRESIRLVVLAALPAALPLMADPAADAYRDARAHLVARRFAEAADGFRKATQTTNAVAAAAWFGLGEASYGLKRWDEAIAAYGTVLARHPDAPFAPNALYSRGQAEFHAGRQEDALATFLAFKGRYPAHALASSCASAADSLAATLRAQAQREELARIAGELAAIDAAVRNGKFTEARAAASRFLDAHPAHARAAELRHLMATCACRATQYAEAAEDFRVFLQHHPRHALAAAAQMRLAECLLKAERYDEAREAFGALAETREDPQEKARATLALGDCDAAQSRWEDAERAYLNVEVLQASEALRPVALKRLAELYDMMGRPDKARRAREDLRRRYPGE
jgi:TolA-binding protein